jgi:uncharacterized surface protein with fasciclin (FAS1) repeats
MKRLLLALAALATISFAVAQGTIMEVAQADDRFETFVEAANVAGLADTLSGEGLFTVFVPTDQAFNRIADLDGLLQQQETLRRILQLHVVPGVVAASEIAAESPLSTVLDGAALAVRVVDGTVYVGDAIVTVTGIEASNGIIHVIDTVLTPPAQ